jgi:beta-1,4-mannosyltransferase
MKLPDISLAESAPEKFVALHEAALARGDVREPVVIICWPDARMNKYQALLYSTAQENGFDIVRIANLGQLANLWWPGRLVLHAHWFSQIYAECATEADALAANALTQETLLNFRHRTGAKLVWTAHNVLPHGTPFAEAALAMRRWIVDRFDAVHLLDRQHEKILETAFGMPLNRTIVAPHPLYTNVYPDYVRRDEARAIFGIQHDATVFLSFGSLQAYKRYDILLDAFARVSKGRGTQRALLIAGKPVDAAVTAMLTEAVSRDPNIRLTAATVPDEDVQYYVRASDALVLTQFETLNSGTALLGCSFGVPVIAPETPSFRSLQPLGVHTYDPPSSGALAAKMEEFLNREGSFGSAQMRTSGSSSGYQPQNVSMQFLSGVRNLFDRAGA